MTIKHKEPDNKIIQKTIESITKKKDILVTTSLPPDLYKDFKCIVVKNDTSIKKVLIKLLESYIEENK